MNTQTASLNRALIKLHWLELVRNRAYFAFVLLFPFFMMGTFYFLQRVIGSSADGGPDFNAVILPMGAYLAVTGTSLTLTAGPLAQYREQSTFRVLSTTPLSRARFLLTHLSTRFAAALVLCLGVFIFGLATGLTTLGALPRLALSVLPGLALFLAVGYLLGGLFGNGQVATQIATFAQLIALFLSGVALPLWLLPEPARTVIGWLPPALAADPIFWAAKSKLQLHPVLLSSGIVLGTAAIVMAVAVRTFRWDAEAR